VVTVWPVPTSVEVTIIFYLFTEGKSLFHWIVKRVSEHIILPEFFESRARRDMLHVLPVYLFF
jgi:hypothetical protein